MNKLLSLKQLSSSSLHLNANALKQFFTIAPKHNFNFPIKHYQSHCYTYTPNTTYGFFSKHMFSKKISSIVHFKGTLNSFLGSRLFSVKRRFRSRPPSVLKRKGSSWFQGYSADNLVVCLIVANAAVFVLWRFLDRDFMLDNFTISVDNLKSGRFHTLITCAFSHIDMAYLVHNMIGLYVFGGNIARYFGPAYLLKLYFTVAVVGSLFHFVYHAFIVKMSQNQGTFGMDSSKTPGLGASGVASAVVLLDIFLFPKAKIMFAFFIPFPAVLLGFYLLFRDVSRIVEGDPQASGSAHLGGTAAAAAAAALLRLKKGRVFRY